MHAQTKHNKVTTS